MARDIAGDIRLDPRVKAFLADDAAEPECDVDSRETLLAEANSEEARADAEKFRQFITNRATVGYGIEAFTERNPLAWPSFATAADVAGFPPVVISVHECDPLRDEGVNFYRLLLAAGVPARCRQVMGAMHAVETFTTVCPEISRDTARDLAAFCKGEPR